MSDATTPRDNASLLAGICQAYLTDASHRRVLPPVRLPRTPRCANCNRPLSRDAAGKLCCEYCGAGID